MTIGDPPNGGWQQIPQRQNIPTWDPGTFWPTGQPGTGTTVPYQPQVDLSQLYKQLQNQKDVKVEERLANIERSLIAILELLGTVLAARQQQLEAPEKEK